MKVVDGAGDFIASHHNVYISLLKVKSLEIIILYKILSYLVLFFVKNTKIVSIVHF